MSKRRKGKHPPLAIMDYLSHDVPVTLLADKPIKHWNAVIKACEDYLIGAIATTVLLPIGLLIALAIKLDSPGPVIFKQRRHTLNNREFDIYKFRTMRWEASTATESLRQTIRQDNRVTTVGRFLRRSSLDELPQLINVFKGEMSLVGPRPHAINMRTENHLGCEISEQFAGSELGLPSGHRPRRRKAPSQMREFIRNK